MKRTLVILIVLITVAVSASAQQWIRVNQMGYLPDAIKTAVFAGKGEASTLKEFVVKEALSDNVVYRGKDVVKYGAYGPFSYGYRLRFSPFRREGAYYVEANGTRSPIFRIGANVYDGAADFLLRYMRQQRSGYNPFLRDSCHTHDGFIIYHPTLDSTHINVSGGWHDASDYLQYVTTSANATFQMLFAYQKNPESFRDGFDAKGHPGANGIPDILDEAKWGLDWLVKMNPDSGMMFNQLADDRDHAGFRLPTQDPVTYGKGKERPVYFCTGQPQGVFENKNRATGIASTAGKYASAFGMGSEILRPFYPEYAEKIRLKSRQAYEFGKLHPGACQTAPCKAPYFYEEDNWVDDMQLGGSVLAKIGMGTKYLDEAAQFGAQEPVTPWMGADTAAHYQWYPFLNVGHYLVAMQREAAEKARFAGYMKEGIERVRSRGENMFLFGVPFIWCSNNLVSAMVTQIRLYEELTGDNQYAEMEAALLDWLFGCNPWGTSMIYGLPAWGDTPRDPHSAFTHHHGYPIDGGLVDGPVYGSIFNNLKGLHLSKPDAYAEFQSDLAVYHDDWGDYSTNEPTMDGTASLSFYFSYLEARGKKQRHQPAWDANAVKSHGGVIRMDTTKKEIYLVFTGHEFANSGDAIAATLKRQKVKAGFFFTGDFYRTKNFAPLIKKLKKGGHYLGAHSDKHLLYAPWENRDSLLVTQEKFADDIRANYSAMSKFGIVPSAAEYFIPPYEWYNDSVAAWCTGLGLRLVNFTPGTYSNADYTVPSMGEKHLSSDSIYARILRAEKQMGLNGAVLLMHVGAHPERTDLFHAKLNALLTELKKRGYEFRSFSDVPRIPTKEM